MPVSNVPLAELCLTSSLLARTTQSYLHAIITKILVCFGKEAKKTKTKKTEAIIKTPFCSCAFVYIVFIIQICGLNFPKISI